MNRKENEVSTSRRKKQRSTDIHDKQISNSKKSTGYKLRITNIIHKSVDITLY